MVMLVGLLRLGWIAEFLSTPIVTGFLSGVAVIIVVHQLPDLLGLPSAGGTNLHRVAYVLTHLSQVNGWTLAIGVAVLAVMVVSARLDRRIPGCTDRSGRLDRARAALGLQAHGVAVLGTVADGAPHLGSAGLSWSTLGSLAPLAAVVALVVVTQSAATTRAFAEQGGYDVDAGRDFLGVGAGSVAGRAGGLLPGGRQPAAHGGGRHGRRPRPRPAHSPPPRLVVLLIPVAGVLKDVPLATLAAVLIFVALRLFHPGDLVAIARFDSSSSAWRR